MSRHAKISYFKSGIRIVGFAALTTNLWGAAFVLIVAEIIGILEEVGE